LAQEVFLHTDTAFWALPARFLVMRATGDKRRTTRVCPFDELLAHGGNSLAVAINKAVSPRAFKCFACGLKLAGYAELDGADLGGTYTRRTTFTPEDYYGLIDPETADMSEYFGRYMADMQEYDNE
jgi:hypothetical protein